MELKIVKQPFGGNESWGHVYSYLYKESEGGLQQWFEKIEQLERTNPDVILYLYDIESWQDSGETFYRVRCTFKMDDHKCKFRHKVSLWDNEELFGRFQAMQQTLDTLIAMDAVASGGFREEALRESYQWIFDIFEEEIEHRRNWPFNS